jgi:hypothetical protein
MNISKLKVSIVHYNRSFILVRVLLIKYYCIDTCPHFMGLLKAQRILAMNSKIYPLGIFLVVIRIASCFVLD